MALGRVRLKSTPSARRELAVLAVAAFATFALTTLALKTVFLSAGVVIIWPVEGVILALTLGPLRHRPWLTLVMCRAGGVAAGLMAGYAVLDCMQVNLVNVFCTGALIYWGQRKLGPNWFADSASLVRFLIAACLASIAMSAAHTTLLPAGVNRATFFWAEVPAAVAGLAVMAPLVGIFTRDGLVASTDWRRSLATLTVYSAVVLAVFLQDHNSLLYIIPLGLMLLAYIEDLTAVAIAVSATVVIALATTLLGHGPFELGQSHFELTSESSSRLGALQIFLVVITTTSLPIAVLMEEHARLKQTLIKSRQDAEAANQAKSIFLATVSHEIRTPLNGVLGMAQVLATENLTPEQHAQVEIVRSSGMNLLALLNDVLDLSKIEAGKLTIETIDFDLQELLEGIVDTHAATAREKQVALSLDMGETAGVYRGDPTRLRQIIGNLVSNGLKFSAEGEVRIISRLEPDGLALAVKDSGIGIPPEKLDRLFAKFSQVDDSTTRRFGGTGLGLAICRELAEVMGGRIEVRSEFGTGSTFTVHMPLKRIAGRVVKTDAPSAPLAPASLDGLRVLAAEDNATNRLVLKTLLAVVGVEVTLVEDGAEAVAAWEREPWDVILMDIQMPVLDGRAATRAIRAREAELGRPRTAIVALTANTMAHQIGPYLADGMDGHLAKPIDAGALFAALAAVHPIYGPSMDDRDGVESDRRGARVEAG
jgi:signal transduction histidine kinase/ActR/RegA family two-component response regulator